MTTPSATRQAKTLARVAAYRVREPRRLLAAVAPVILGVMGYLLAGGFIEYIYYALREGAIRSHVGHIQVTVADYAERGHAEPFRTLLPADGRLERQLAALPGVLTVAPRLNFTALASLGDNTLSVVGEGVDPARERELSRQVRIESGQDLDPAQPNGVLLGQGLAKQLGARPGDVLVLLTTTSRGSTGAIEATVRGIFSSPVKAYDDVAVRIPIASAERLVQVHGAHRWLMLLEKTSDTDRVLAQVSALVKPQGLVAQPWYKLSDFYNKTVALFSRQVAVVQVIIAVIIVLSVSNTLSMSVMERVREIGTTLALGLRRRDVLLQFMVEGVVFGLVGAAVGVGIGAMLALLISAIGIPMPPPPGMARGYIGEIRLTLPLVCNAIALAVIPSLVASVAPAWKASRLNIVDALRQGR